MDSTVLSILTTTPFLRPRDGWIPTPSTSTTPLLLMSPMMAQIFVVPMSSPTTILCPLRPIARPRHALAVRDDNDSLAVREVYGSYCEMLLGDIPQGQRQTPKLERNALFTQTDVKGILLKAPYGDARGLHGERGQTQRLGQGRRLIGLEELKGPLDLLLT